MVTTGYIEHDVFVQDLKLHYQEWGNPSAPPILMLHGFGVSGHMFDEFAERMQDRYRLIALDQRGHGDSDWSPEGDYSRQAFVNDLEGFREALGIERFILVGHSMGGLNAVTYTVERPENVRALILVDVGPEAAKEGVDNIVRFTRGPDELEFEQFVEMAHRFNPRRTIDNIRERMRHRLKPTEGGKWTWKFDKRFREEKNGLKIGSSLTNDETWELYRSVRVPTLLVRGAESDVLSQEVAERAAREMQSAKLVVVAGAGHSVPGDSPDDFTAAVREFIGDLDTGRFAPAAATEPPPLRDLMQEEERRERRGPGLATMVLIGVGAGAALAGVAFLASRQSRKKSKGVRDRVRAAAPLVVEPLRAVDVEKVRERASQLAGDLAILSREGMKRARTTLDEVDVDRARDSAIEIVHALGERTKGAQGAVRSAVGRAGPRRPKRQGWLRPRRNRPRARNLALRLALAGATKLLVSGMRQERPRRKLLAWRG